MRNKNALDSNGLFYPVIRPWLLTPLAVIIANPTNYAAKYQEAIDAYDASGALPMKDRMVEVILEPGVYPSIPQGYNYVHSTTFNPDNVVVENGTASDGVVRTWGSPFWVEGITIRSLEATSGTGPKYPIHHTGAGTQIYINCKIESQNSLAEGGPALVGLDGGDGLSMHFYKCTFDNGGGILTNIHGAASNVGEVEVAFIDCTAVAPTNTAVSYDSLGSTSTDRIYVAGGNLTAGVETGANVDIITTGEWPTPVGGLAAPHRYSFFPAL